MSKKYEITENENLVIESDNINANVLKLAKKIWKNLADKENSAVYVSNDKLKIVIS